MLKSKIENQKIENNQDESIKKLSQQDKAQLREGR